MHKKYAKNQWKPPRPSQFLYDYDPGGHTGLSLPTFHLSYKIFRQPFYPKPLCISHKSDFYLGKGNTGW